MIYNYTKEVNLSLLEKQINDSAITIALKGISQTGESLAIEFKASLSTSKQTLLDIIVDAHDKNLPWNDSAIVAVEIHDSNRPIFKQEAFAYPDDLRFKGQSIKGDITETGTITISYEIPYLTRLSGGKLISTSSNIKDHCTFKVIDKNNILGFGENVLLDEFIKEYHINKSGELEISSPYAVRLPQGLFVELSYYANDSTGAEIFCNLYLHKEG